MAGKLLTDERLLIMLIICITGPQYLPSTLYYAKAMRMLEVVYLFHTTAT